MAILKCKMCGGDIEISDDKTFGTCESCGSTMTFPKLDDEQRADAFNRGNHFRRIGEFDKALSVYERIVEEEPTNAEAHWCCALCRFGIEYVEDPASFEYVPTCHRASFDIFTEDVDFLAAVENADGITKKQYQKDGAKIAEVQRGILKTSQNEEPFDVFICYKESDDGGNRTVDSTLAQDIYYQLTDAGLRVFFARITLEDKVGSEYEPYIFAALNSAKAMVVVGTKPEYFNAVWVKNEWSRYLSIVKRDRSKVILPCYKDMDPYDLPEQLSVLQSYDMSKIGFIQDLIRGVKKIAQTDKPKPTETVVINNESAHIEPLLKRAAMSLEDGEWQKADEFCEQVLNQDPENAKAYLYKLMAELKVRKKEELKNEKEPFDNSPNYQKAVRFGDNELKSIISYINDRNENAKLEKTYQDLISDYKRASSEEAYYQLNEMFLSIAEYKDAESLAEQCSEKAGQLKQERLAKEENDRLEAQRKAEERRIAAEKAAKKRKKTFAIGTPIVAVCIAFVIVLITVILPNVRLNNLKSGNYDIGDTVKFGNYHNSDEWIVLDKQENRMLLISKYALDCQPYNTSYIDVTWESCSLRKWLNDDFMNEAFSKKEQSIIAKTAISADKNPEYSTNPGNATTDKVFLLSITETEKYFSSDSARQCKPTKYAVANGADVDSDNGNCWWWLRSPGYGEAIAARIIDDGSVFYYGFTLNCDYDCVRPALWISLK